MVNLDKEIQEARDSLILTKGDSEFEDYTDDKLMDVDNLDFNVGFDLGWLKALEYIKNGADNR